MSESRFRGVYVIAVTPFDEEGRVDEESLRAEVEFCIEAGVHGIVTPANASEFYALSDAERRLVGRTVVEQARKRVPVILSVTGGSAQTMVETTRAAQEGGADGLMAMPPPLIPPHREGIFEYYRALSKAARVPIIVQNCHPPLGTPMPPEFVARLVDELEWVDYVKEETDPCTHLISRVTALIQKRDKLKGIFGGQAGRHLMNELARGICGTMPACDVPDAHLAVWNAYERGDVSEARRLHARLLPLITMEALYPMTLYKEVLRRRGVIRTAKVRNPRYGPMDEIDRRELDAVLEEISDLLAVKGPFR